MNRSVALGRACDVPVARVAVVLGRGPAACGAWRAYREKHYSVALHGMPLSSKRGVEIKHLELLSATENEDCVSVIVRDHGRDGLAFARRKNVLTL
eukprot:2203642-Pleurochrysis_carterae.AAC.1